MQNKSKAHIIPRNQIVESMKNVDFSDLKMPMVCVYNKPFDFPDKIIARAFDAVESAATNICAVYDTLKDCREDITAAGFSICIPRDSNDDMCIVESYMK